MRLPAIIGAYNGEEGDDNQIEVEGDDVAITCLGTL